MTPPIFLTAAVSALLLAPLAIPATAAVRILLYSRRDEARPADCAIVLGAAVWDDQPSPVFQERLNHGIELWRRGMVRFVLLTGGITRGRPRAESQVAREYLLARGVPAVAILLEDQSRTTFENFVHGRHVMEEHGLSTALVVTDPLHAYRSLAMARRLGIQAWSSPTPTTRFVSWKKKGPFLWRETKGLMWFRVLGR